jgi:hypothetical protein
MEAKNKKFPYEHSRAKKTFWEERLLSACVKWRNNLKISPILLKNDKRKCFRNYIK